mgnify:CR=1 FL=1
MKKGILTTIMVVAAGAYAVDAGRYGPNDRGTPPKVDVATSELSVDNGTWKYLFAWNTGRDVWVGNQFLGGPKPSYRIHTIKLFTSTVWPNETWEGFRVAVFGYDGSRPTSMLWPTGGTGSFFKPSGLTGHVWVEVPVDYLGPNRFVAAVEQFYGGNACDPCAVDSNPTPLGRSWQKYGAEPWKSLQPMTDPYFNLMLRVIVEEETAPAVTPATLGRVKALYY